MDLQELADTTVCISNDIHALHLGAYDINFDDAHKKVTNKYYQKTAEEYDATAEKLCMFGEVPLNKNGAAGRLTWESVEGAHSSIEIFQELDRLLTAYLQALVDTHSEFKDQDGARPIAVCNYLEQLIEDWSEEKFFFNARRIQEAVDMTGAPDMGTDTEETLL